MPSAVTSAAIIESRAMRICRDFGTDAQSWINLQARYDLKVTRRASGRRSGREVMPRAACRANA
jgi:antitoxin HigA-1